MKVDAAVDHHEALERGARLGYAARGLVYLIIGGLAFLGGIGRGGGTTDTKGALVTLLGQPFGRILLALVAVGLLSYAIWRFVMAVKDPEQHGTEGSALVRRGAYLVSGILNLGIAVVAASLAFPGLLPTAGGGGEQGAQSWAAWLMHQPYGRWLVALVGLVVMGAAVAFAVRAAKAAFEKELDPRCCTPAIRNICRAGILARAVVFAIIGLFLILAAWHANPSEVKGLGEALDTLRRQPYGPWLLAAVGLGLAAFGLYSFIAARCRRIQTG
jgi:hypothetical protein